MGGGVLERFQRHRGRQEVAEYDCTRHTDALVVQIEVRNAVLTQRDEWDAAEVSQRCVLKHHLGQLLRSIARDVVHARNAVQDGQGMQVSAAADTFVSVTCGAEGRVATYLSDVRLLFVDKASPSAFAPSSWILFPAKL